MPTQEQIVALQIQHASQIADLSARVDNLENNAEVIHDNDLAINKLETIVEIFMKDSENRERARREESEKRDAQIERQNRILDALSDSVKEITSNLHNLNEKVVDIDDNQQCLKKEVNTRIETLEGCFKQSEEKSKIDLRMIIKNVAESAITKWLFWIVTAGGVIYIIADKANIDLSKIFK